MWGALPVEPAMSPSGTRQHPLPEPLPPMNTRLFTAAAAFLATAAVMPVPASAQPIVLQSRLPDLARSSTRGLNLGVHLNGSALEYEEWQGTESGGGGGVRLGYGFNDLFTMYSQVDHANMISADGTEEYNLTQLDLGGRFSFRARSRTLRPYVDVAVSGRAVRTDYLGSPLTMSGSAFTLGGGLQYYFARHAAVDVGIKGSGGAFNRITYEATTETFEGGNATSSRFNLGLSFYAGG